MNEQKKPLNSDWNQNTVNKELNPVAPPQPIVIEPLPISSNVTSSKEENPSNPIIPSSPITQLDKNPTLPTSIPPIAPVEIKSEENPSPNELPKEKREEYVGNIRPKGYIGAIFVFVILAGFIFGLPYIDDYLASKRGKEQLAQIDQATKEEEEKQKQEEEERKNQSAVEKTSQMSCTLPHSLSDTAQATITEIRILEYSKDIIQKVTISRQATYTLESDPTFITAKANCEERSIRYANKVGYETSCNLTGLTIETTETFELATFESITDEVSGEIIESPYKKNTSYQSTIQQLTESGAVCQ